MTYSVAEIREKGVKYQPESSTIKTMTYLVDEKKMLVDFHTGGTYIYFDVSPEVWDYILKAESAGKAFSEKIKKADVPWEKVQTEKSAQEVSI